VCAEKSYCFILFPFDLHIVFHSLEDILVSINTSGIDIYTKRSAESFLCCSLYITSTTLFILCPSFVCFTHKCFSVQVPAVRTHLLQRIFILWSTSGNTNCGESQDLIYILQNISGVCVWKWGYVRQMWKKRCRKGGTNAIKWQILGPIASVLSNVKPFVSGSMTLICHATG